MAGGFFCSRRSRAGAGRGGLGQLFCDRLPRCGRVAQLVEQRPFKAWVLGSSPSALTMILNNLRQIKEALFRHRRHPAKRKARRLVADGGFPWLQLRRQLLRYDDLRRIRLKAGSYPGDDGEPVMMFVFPDADYHRCVQQTDQPEFRFS